MSIDRDVPAFPNALESPTNDGYLSTGGMSLRDYFAAKAMQALLTGDAARGIASTNLGSYRGEVAEQCYEIADAMLARRDA